VAQLPEGSSQLWPQVWTGPASQLVDAPCGETTRQQTHQVPLTTYAGGNHPQDFRRIRQVATKRSGAEKLDCIPVLSDVGKRH
jgi:hypothetical protein